MSFGANILGRSCVQLEDGRTRIPKICIHGYECGHCAFDQWISEIEERQRPKESCKLRREELTEAA